MREEFQDVIFRLVRLSEGESYGGWPTKLARHLVGNGSIVPCLITKVPGLSFVDCNMFDSIETTQVCKRLWMLVKLLYIVEAEDILIGVSLSSSIIVVAENDGTVLECDTARFPADLQNNWNL
jgi:hypothetical protein